MSMITKADYDELVRLRAEGIASVFETSNVPQEIVGIHKNGHAVFLRESRTDDYVKYESGKRYVIHLIAEYERAQEVNHE